MAGGWKIPTAYAVMSNYGSLPAAFIINSFLTPQSVPSKRRSQSVHHNVAREVQERERDGFQLGRRCGGMGRIFPFVRFWVKSVASAMCVLRSRQQISALSANGSRLVGWLGGWLVLEAHFWGAGPLG